MEKIWIIYDSKFGNCKQLAEELMKNVQTQYETHISYVKTIDPELVIEDNPVAVFIGSPIRAGRPSFTIMRWIGKLKKKLKSNGKQIPKGIFFCTAAGTPQHGKKIQDAFNGTSVIGQFYPEIISVLVADIKGPIKAGEIEKVQMLKPKIVDFVKVS